VAKLIEKITDTSARIGVIGLGYVGLPLAIAFARRGFTVLGLDIDPEKPKRLHGGESYLKHIPASTFGPLMAQGKFSASTDFARAAECDALLICVPTPLTESREPDLSYIEATARTLAGTLRPGQLVALESTTYPGTTDELLRPILEKGSGLRAGVDFFLVYSPEREDPGNKTFHAGNTPKVIGGHSPACLEAGKALYGAVVDQVVPVSSTSAAEMTKLFENVYRAVNIAMVNELKLLCQRMDLNVWEVIEAAATKPFGFQAFYPGPGLGGHCIPIDPFYLTWKARQLDMNTRFIELAGEINTAMPYHVVARVQDALNTRQKSLSGSQVLILGVAYKKDVDDMRESPALTIIDLLQKQGAQVSYHDPHVPALKKTRKYHFALHSAPLDQKTLTQCDCALIVTNHRAVDYDLVAKHADLIVDTRNQLPPEPGHILGA